MDSSIVLVLVAVALCAVLVLVGLLLYVRGTGSKSAAVKAGLLLVGPANAGKTLLFLQLSQGKARPTHTSMEPNYGQITLDSGSNKPLTVADLPGHERLYRNMLARHAPGAVAVIFVIDSTALRAETDGVRRAAEFLYDMLTDKHLRKRPLLIVCNKQDIPTAIKARAVQIKLEKELNALRSTRNAALGDTTGKESSADVFLGNPDEDFSFEHLQQPVRFMELSCKGTPDLAELRAWIQHSV